MPWLVHGFSTRSGGQSTVYSTDGQTGELNLGLTAEDDRERVLANRRAYLREVCGLAEKEAGERLLLQVRQVHSRIVLRVGHADLEKEPETADGMVTDERGLLLAIQTADCVPVLVVDPEHKAVGAFHAGWRGTAQSIVEHGVRQMKAEFGSRPEHLEAALGPCIGGCCYEVGEDVREEFRRQFSDAEELFEETADGLRLDLVEANRRQLQRAGLSAERTFALNACTACGPEGFFSYRKSGGRTGRMMAVIGLRNESRRT